MNIYRKSEIPKHLLKHFEPAEIGLEQTPEEFIQKLVNVFREVKRVLRDDGTCWVNMGDSYCNNDKWGGGGGNTGKQTVSADGSVPSWAVRARKPMTDVSYFLHGLLKRGVLFCGQTRPARKTAESPCVFIYNETSPDRVLFPLLGVQRVLIKEGDNNLCEIGDSFDSPVRCFASATLVRALPCDPHIEGSVNAIKNVSIVVSACDLDSDPTIRNTISLPMENGQASFSIEVAGEPVPESIINRKPVRNALLLNAVGEGVCNVNLVNDSVAFADGLGSSAGSLRDFDIGHASAEKLDLSLMSGINLSFRTVAHLHSSSDAGISPYSELYAQATRKANANKPKQEMGMPEMLKRALMEDGWICRQTIIWHKPNPMPESVQDRCTKSHEYLFLLSKSPRYYYDAEAVMEAGSGQPWNSAKSTLAANGVKNVALNKSGQRRTAGADTHHEDIDRTGRNKRSVWTIPTYSYSGAHFATFPPKLVEPCIRAGTSEHGVCGECGAPFVRVTEKGRVATRPGTDTKVTGVAIVDGNRDPQRHVTKTVTTGWEASCDCHDIQLRGAVVLDCFGGSGTTLQVAVDHGRRAIAMELNPAYVKLIQKRMRLVTPPLTLAAS